MLQIHLEESKCRFQLHVATVMKQNNKNSDKKTFLLKMDFDKARKKEAHLIPEGVKFSLQQPKH